MSTLLYVDAVGGIAGDMLLAALLDAGADEASVRDGLRTLGLDGLQIEIGRTHRHGISACRVNVIAPAEPQTHRSWRDIHALLDASQLPERARARAQLVFAALARAEGHVHGIEPEAVTFHEVGALDAIGDICAVALALEDLGVEELACSPLPTPRGLVTAAHGQLPLPGPATLELLRGAPLYGVDSDVELVTPTGAALIAALGAEYGPLPAMRLVAVGYGAGSRDLAQLPNIVRVLIGERELTEDSGAHEEVRLIEASLDDLSPELVPDAVERCLQAGALDVWVTAAQMKKGRPGIVLCALARPVDERAVSEVILRETTTLGVRVIAARRWELDREWVTVAVAGEAVRVKVGLLDGQVVNASPEHDDCAAVANRTGQPVKAIWTAALAALQREDPR